MIDKIPSDYNGPYTNTGRRPRHGCALEINGGAIAHAPLTHMAENGVETIPTIRSYDDGIKIGCTFLSTTALYQIFNWHSKYLEPVEKIGLHQKGYE